MAYFFYNTDGGQGRFHILIKGGFAATGGPRARTATRVCACCKSCRRRKRASRGTATVCRLAGARRVQKEILEKYPTANVRVYAIWFSMLPTDGRTMWRWGGSTLTDSRVAFITCLFHGCVENL